MAVIALMDVVDGGRLWKFMGRGVLIYVKKRGGKIYLNLLYISGLFNEIGWFC